jgi:hypothetical protein
VDLVTAAAEVGTLNGAVATSQIFLEHLKKHPSIYRRLKNTGKQMKQYVNTFIMTGMALNLMCFAFATSQKVSGNITSKTALNEQQQSLVIIAKHARSDTCWKQNTKALAKIGDIVEVPGTITGKVPTSYFYNPTTKQFLYVAYNQSELTIQRIFSIREVRNQLSIKESN